jgi:hypothetical protein
VHFFENGGGFFFQVLIHSYLYVVTTVIIVLCRREVKLNFAVLRAGACGVWFRCLRGRKNL